MKITQIPFQKTGFFSKTMHHYLEKDERILPFYENFPDVKGFEKQIETKRLSVRAQSRTILVDVLKKQYQLLDCARSDKKTVTKTQKNIELLSKENTFTITTGHQLNLFTGPLYFLYKILSTINLCEELSEKFPKQHFVPIYWMATEDHDFEEINYFNFKDKKVQWNSNQTGAVGRFSTDGLEAVLKQFSDTLGTSKNTTELKKLFSDAYVKHKNLADATRFIADKLFGNYGLVVLDADDKALKKEFVPFVKEELLQQVSHQHVSKTITEFGKNYKVQVNPREINLFYLIDGLRERILFENEMYKVHNTAIKWSLSEIQKEVCDFPERFSPNVIMRPLYQEVILPNLCYIGGGGEIAYWLELKTYFEAVHIPFPILLLRNSVQIVSEKQQRKLDRLSISTEELFLNQHSLVAKKVKEKSIVKVDFTEQKKILKTQFNRLKEIAKQTDISFIGAVNAQEKKQLNGLVNLEKRLLRAEKRKQSDLVHSIIKLQNELLPNQSLEERYRNFSDYYVEYGEEFIVALKENLQPLQLEFTVVSM